MIRTDGVPTIAWARPLVLSESNSVQPSLKVVKEIDCPHWIRPTHAAVDGVDLPHWSIDQEGGTK